MLTLDPEKVCFIVLKARAFDAKIDIIEPEPGATPADEELREFPEDDIEDPNFAELKAAIDMLNEDEQIELVALTWLGRDDFSAAEWEEAKDRAAEAHNERTADYLLGIPVLGDYLEEGLSMMGHSCENFEREHL